ncbi:MAG: radical SAM protein [Spartobacteria bacterium]|nr:radical SAM protein [Spartobacteria bacterium]
MNWRAPQSNASIKQEGSPSVLVHNTDGDDTIMQPQEPYTYLFGPVPSRRFGRSLGVDLTPYKTCSFNCVFCQLGPTLNTTVERREYVPTADALRELASWLDDGSKADYITLSGSGEPTLHSRFGDVLAWVNDHSAIPSVLLTNGSMLRLPEVREGAAHAKVVKISMSAWDQPSLEWVNRPHPTLRLDEMHEGIKAFRAMYDGEIWVEVFLVSGLNSIPADVKKIAALVKDIHPERVQLNTAVRPPAEEIAAAVSAAQMAALKDLFEPPGEVIADYSADRDSQVRVNEFTILAMLKRRPCTATDIAQAFGMHLNEVAKYLGKLTHTGRIVPVRKDNQLHYFDSKNINNPTTEKDPTG